MPPLVIPGTVQVRWLWSRGGAPAAVNVMHYAADGAAVVNGTTADAFAASLVAAWTEVQARITNTMQLTSVGIRDIREANLPEFIGAVNQNGTNTGDMLPPQVAFVSTLRTAQAGRSFRGRVYWPGPTDGDNLAGGVAAAIWGTSTTAFLEAQQQVISGADTYLLAVASRTLLESNPVIAVEARNLVWDTQRRRAR